MKVEDCLSYDDVLLRPQYSDIRSRSEIDISTDLGNDLGLQLPIISSPMDTISEDDMAICLSRHGGCSVIHRYNTIEEQTRLVVRALEQAATRLLSAPQWGLVETS